MYSDLRNSAVHEYLAAGHAAAVVARQKERGGGGLFRAV
jgi:hypothetical protein